MKKIFSIILALAVFLSFNALALDITLFDIRNKIFEESKEIKALLPDSKDVVLVSSMWDSCLIAITQLDAYFSMLGIFNTIKKEDLSKDSINYLSDWLNEIKRTDTLNIESLNSVPQPVELDTEVHIERLKDYFTDLNNRIDAELKKLSILEDALEITLE